MSIDSARAFLERVKTDEAWREALSAADSKDERLAMARAEGFDFTKEELKMVKYELSDEDLDAVVGGVSHHGNWCCSWFTECSDDD
jgi:predicted ribosomally synthesized peptide with nif11-like leader